MLTPLRRSVTRVSLAALIAILFAWFAAAPAPATPLPSSMAGLGDSITRAFNTEYDPSCNPLFVFGLLDCPRNSWSTGTSSAVNSILQRIQASGRPDALGFNDARSGARMNELATQASTAVSQHVRYATVLMGANDACRSTLDAQTPTETFRSQLRNGLSTLAKGKVFIQVASIPDINQLWELFHTDPNALIRWAPGVLSASGTCQALLANPTSFDPADVARRSAFRAQVMAYNNVLNNECATTARCMFDGYATFDGRFTTADVATLDTTPLADYFHPSIHGQNTLAELVWTHSGFYPTP
jgi:lysophospholipase L1-like esterase